MAFSMMTQSCGKACKQEEDFKITLGIESLEMSDENEDDLFEDVLVTIAWDGIVEKMTKTSGEPDEFQELKEFTIHSSSENLTEKLKLCPIMFNLSRGCDDLGSVKLPIPKCVAEAVLCADFNSQTVINDLKFEVKGDQNGKMTVKFGIEKISCDEASKKIYQKLQIHKNDRKKNERKIKSKKKNASGSDEEVEEELDEETCSGFKCPHELPDHCKQDLGLSKSVYRIINGNLVNVEDKIGICGEKCQATRKIVKNICKENSSVPLSKLFEFKDDDPKCVDLFHKTSLEYPECGGQRTNVPVESKGRLQKNNWMERNLQEEDLLRKLCEKYGIDADEVRALGEKVEKCKTKKTRKKKFRKSKNVESIPAENKT